MDTPRNPIQVLQITDTHLYAVVSGTLLKMNTHSSLEAVLDRLKSSQEKFDLILATGDIAQDASPAAYQHFLNYMEPLNAPVRWLPGNHDEVRVMQDVAGDRGTSNKVEVIDNWQFVLLDSTRTNHVDGYLGEGELAFLNSALVEAEISPEIEHTLISLHHNPVPGSSSWMKDIGLRNDREFLDILRRHSTVRCVVYGHIHQELDFKLDNIRFFCTPSTCIQFKPEVIDFSLDEKNPGYRRITLFPDGHIDSEVIRIDGNRFNPDFDSEGY